MIKLTPGVAALMISGMAMTSAPVLAKTANDAGIVPVQLVEDIGASERVEAAALLRVLSQEAASAACHMAHDINPKEARNLMVEAKGKFSLLLDALQFGNPTMNIIGAEGSRRTVAMIDEVRAQWAPVFEAAVVLLDDPKNDAALTRIKAENEAVLASASLLTSQIAGEYSNPAELLQADVMLLDFAGRQAMLTQKMAKIACEIWVGNRTEDRLDLLTSSIGIYDLTLQALLNGMPAAGIKAAPTDAIKVKLEKAGKDWAVIKEALSLVLANDTVDDALKASLFHDLNVAMYDMEALEHMYVAYSKHDYSDTDEGVHEGKLLD